MLRPNIIWILCLHTETFTGVGPIPNSDECSRLTDIPQQFRPILFWFFTHDPEPLASIVMCTPNLQLYNVEATLDLASRNLTDVHPVSSFIPSRSSADPAGNTSEIARLASNVTGYPLNGHAYNGLFFDTTINTSDPYVSPRQTAIQLALPAAVFQAALSSDQGLTGTFKNGDFVNLANRVYVGHFPMSMFSSEANHAPS